MIKSTEPESDSAVNASEEQTMNVQSTSQSSAVSESDAREYQRDPYEVPPYPVSRDSDDYRNWRRLQHQRGMRNLVVALLVFGGLAIIYTLLK